MLMPQPDPSLIGVFALLALHMCAVYTGLGAFALAVAAELLAGAKGKIFLKKSAQQFSSLGVLFLLYTLISAGGSFLVLRWRLPELIQPWLDAPLLAAPGLIVLGWTVLFSLIYALSWNMAKTSAGLHKFLGILAAVGMPALLAVSLALKLILVPGLPDVPADADALALVLGAGFQHPLYPPLLLATLFLCLGCAGGFGLVYLILRRKRDDFGRDYYAFATRFTARWAALCTTGTLAAHAWLASAMRPELLSTGDGPTFVGWLMTGGGLCALVAVFAWLATALSKTPLRTKPLMVLAALLMLAAVAGLSAADATLFFAPAA